MTPLAELLAERIHRFGPLTFADYMRECLYHPVHGYYSKAESKRFADYYTSVDVHPIFARLLARQFAEMWESLGRPAEFMDVTWPDSKIPISPPTPPPTALTVAVGHEKTRLGRRAIRDAQREREVLLRVSIAN